MKHRRRLLTVGFIVFSLGLQALPAQADFKWGVYEFRFSISRFPLYFEFKGITEVSVDTTPRIDTSYGSFENVTTIDHMPFTMSGTGLDGTLSFEAMRTYLDDMGREIGSFSIMEFNITGMGSFRIEMQSHRGNFTGSYPSWSEVFAATPGTVWSYTYEETVFGELSSRDNSQLPFQNQNTTNDQGPPEAPTNHSIILELEAFETKMVVAGSFECARLNESSYENETYSGSRHLYRTQIGTDYLLVLQEDYTEEGKRMFTRELISLDPSQTAFVTSDSQINSLQAIISTSFILLLVNARTIILLLLGGLVILLVRRIRSRRKRE